MREEKVDNYYYIFGLIAVFFLFLKYVNRKEENEEDDNNECDT